MRIEQALYGEVRGGHSLRAASGTEDLAGELTSRLDLPDTAPLGVNWFSFYSGFPHKDRYIFARTTSDSGASRAGMVLSHALIAPLDELVVVDDLRSLVDLFDRWDNQQLTDLAVLDVTPAQGTIPPATADLADTTAVLALRGSGPVVRLGLEGFDELVVALWARLWPSIRRGFAFRLSFGPGDLVETPSPALVCTPASLAPRWSGFRVVGAIPTQGTESLATSLLRGESGGQALRQFAKDIGASLATFPDVQLLERAYVFRTKAPKTVEPLIAAVRLVERLSPDPSTGPDGKHLLIADLGDQLSVAKARDVLLLRNLDLGAFGDSARVWRTLEHWMSQNRFSSAEDADMLAVLESALSADEAVDGWRKALLAGLEVAPARKEFAEAYWRWAVERPDLIHAVSHQVAATPGIEDVLRRDAPRRLTTAAAITLAETSQSLGWMSLHGIALSAAFSPRIAVERQLAVDHSPSHFEGVRNALRNAAPADILACALALDEPRIVAMAAEAVAADPHLLRNVSMNGLAAQRIWTLALDANPDAWKAPEDPRAVFAGILDRILAGETTHNELIEALARSPVADISEYQRRAEVWSRVTRTARRGLLAATAAGWIRRAVQGVIPFAPDTDLVATILDGDALDKALAELIPTQIQTAVEVVATLESFEQERFLRWLRTLVTRRVRLSETDAAAIGRMILTRRWRRAADDLAHAARSQSELVPAVRVCAELLGFWTRLRLGVSTVSLNEKWEFFEEVATELYPNGPDHEALWSRAGGDNAHLHHSGTGRSRWHHALTEVRRGGGVRVEQLMRKMREDYPHNEKLRYLADDHEFGGIL